MPDRHRMERHRVTRSVAPAYPARTALTSSMARRLAWIAALGTMPLAGCTNEGHLGGFYPMPHEPWAMTLPAEGTRAVVLTSEEAELVYHLELEVQELARECLSTQEEAALGEVDGVLADEPAATFEPGSDLGDVEARTIEVLAAFCGIPMAEFYETSLVVDDLILPGDTGT